MEKKLGGQTGNNWVFWVYFHFFYNEHILLIKLLMEMSNLKVHLERRLITFINSLGNRKIWIVTLDSKSSEV